ncbi:sulfurtransferase [Hydrogenophaga sp. PBL-H3]|uniref:sulfurtransferase n=1 Tax=Hydrogenophaga sp. PBL-H3 TaxID=434010 RepID=UPI0013200B3F|nr:sulfurtransferase [Hydrogenophaga sp. PBL-H3]QHE75640.1 sulfurtransferase [Hydrogenophaga sp. PBL-H3]QHE80066.1 sulfurtransferase [Hydrogenophaga sp. PBL-H3]
MFTTLISASELQQLMSSGTPLRVFDCSFELMKPDAGATQFADEHIAGSVYVHLDQHLSDKTGTDRASGGRHPLPSRETFARRMAALGLSDGVQVVVLDRQGANYCGRLWWMLKWCGHEAVAVLDGGLAAWKAAGGAVVGGPSPQPEPGHFTLKPTAAATASTSAIMQSLGRPAQTLIDARAAARFRGEVEPLDPVAGHIPGALNRPFAENIGPDGLFKPAAQLRAEFEHLLAGRDPASVVHHCGSGVSAIPNLLAMEIAGLGRTALYPGSWSEWCNTPDAPCAAG